jgi:hypothetical protein
MPRKLSSWPTNESIEQRPYCARHLCWKTAFRAYLSELPLGKDVVVSLPDPLNGHGGSKEPISYSKNGKDDNKNYNQGKTCLHRCRKTIQDAPSITAILAASHPRIITIEGGAMKYKPKKSKQHKEGQYPW